MCLKCREIVVVFKEYNVKRHYETKHNDNLKLNNEVKQLKLREFKSQLKTQQKMLVQLYNNNQILLKQAILSHFLLQKKRKHFRMMNL